MASVLTDYKNSSVYKNIKDVIEITEPLKKIGITRFYYVELIDSEYISGLVNDDPMVTMFIKNKGLQKEIALSPHKIIKPGFYPVSSTIKSKTIKNYYDKNFTLSGTSDEIIFIADDNTTRKIYIFGLVDSSYVNRDCLEMFILYFNDTAHHLINKSDRIKIPKELVDYYPPSKPYPKNLISQQVEQEFLDNINAKYYKIKRLQKQFSLSDRESQCLELILQNKIDKEIAYSLDLKTGTINDYMSNLRKKLGCRTKNELVLKIFL